MYLHHGMTPAIEVIDPFMHRISATRLPWNSSHGTLGHRTMQEEIISYHRP